MAVNLPAEDSKQEEKMEEAKTADGQEETSNKKIKRVVSDPRFNNEKYLESQEQKAIMGMAALMGLQGDELKVYLAEMKDS